MNGRLQLRRLKTLDGPNQQLEGKDRNESIYFDRARQKRTVKCFNCKEKKRVEEVVDGVGVWDVWLRRPGTWQTRR